MKISLMATVVAAGMLGFGAQAADLTTVVRAQPDRAVVRIATQGLGYSVLHDVPGVPQRSYRVHVTCTIGERFAQTYCPTPQYDAICPSATIVCR